MLEMEIIVDGHRYIKRFWGDNSLMEMSNLMNILGAVFEKAGVSFEYNQKYYEPQPEENTENEE